MTYALFPLSPAHKSRRSSLHPETQTRTDPSGTLHFTLTSSLKWLKSAKFACGTFFRGVFSETLTKGETWRWGRRRAPISLGAPSSVIHETLARPRGAARAFAGLISGANVHLPVKRTVSEGGREEVAASHFSPLKPRQHTTELRTGGVIIPGSLTYFICTFLLTATLPPFFICSKKP